MKPKAFLGSFDGYVNPNTKGAVNLFVNFAKAEAQKRFGSEGLRLWFSVKKGELVEGPKQFIEVLVFGVGS